MKTTKILILATALLSLTTAVKAQESEVETTISADAVNQYIWRGQKLGEVSIQPTLGVAYKGLSLTGWGNVGIDKGDTKEFDITASYSTGALSIGVTDYWFDSPETRYFYYNSHGTSHLFEAFLGYDFGVFSATWYTNFAGNDGTNDEGKRAYSSYFELNAPFTLGGVDWTGTVGAVPHATTSYGTSGFAVTNMSLKASKDIKVSDSFTLPVFGQVVANPCAQTAYLVFGFTLKP